MSGTTSITFSTAATTTATVSIDSDIASGVEQSLQNNVTSLVLNGNPYISAQVDTVSVTASQTTTLATPPADYNVQNYALIEGAAGANVVVPKYQSGSGYRGAIVDVAGAVTVTGGDPLNGLFVFSAQSDVTFNAEGGYGGINTIYGGGGNNNLTINGVNDVVVLAGGSNTVTAAANVSGGSTYAEITTAGGNNLLNLTTGTNTLLSEGNDTVNVGASSTNNQLTITGAALVNDLGANDQITVTGAATVYALGANAQITAPVGAHVYNVTVDGAGTKIGILVAEPAQAQIQSLVDTMINGPQQSPTGGQSVDFVSAPGGGSTIATPTPVSGALPVLFLSGAAAGVTSLPGTGGYAVVLDDAVGNGTVLGGNSTGGVFIASALANVTYDSTGTRTTILGGGGVDSFTLGGPSAMVSLGGGTNTINVESLVGGGPTSNVINTEGGQSTVNLFANHEIVSSAGQDRILTYDNFDQITVTGSGTFVGLRAGTSGSTVTAAGNADTINVVGTTDVVDATAMSGNGYVFVQATGLAKVTMGAAGTFLTVGTGGEVTGTGAAIDDFGNRNIMSVTGGLLSEYGTNATDIVTGTATMYINGSSNAATLSGSTAAYGKTVDSTFTASQNAAVVLGQLNGGNQVFLSDQANAIVHGDSIVAGGNDLIVTAEGNNAISVTGASGSVVFANGGQDNILVDTALSVFGGNASLSVTGGSGNLVIAEGVGAVTATGGAGATTLFGGTSGNNLLIGGSGDSNLLVAAGGNTTLMGGKGVTTMLGSGGLANAFIAGTGVETMTGAAIAGSTNNFGFGSGSKNVAATILSFGTNSTITLSDGVSLSAPLGPLNATSETLALSNGGSITLIGLTQQLSATSVAGGTVLR